MLRLCHSLFSLAQVAAVSLISEPVACSFACGLTRGVTVVDFGWTHATAAFVADGKTSRFASSTSLGLRRFVSAAVPGAACAPLAAGDAAEFEEAQKRVAAWYLAAPQLAALLGKLPARALEGGTVLLVGGGSGAEGLGSGLAKLLIAALAAKTSMAEASTSATAATDAKRPSTLVRARQSADDDRDSDSDASSSVSDATSSDDSDSSDDDASTTSSDEESGESDADERGGRRENRDHAPRATVARSGAGAAASPAVSRSSNIATVIRMPAAAARVMAFRGASLVAASGALETDGVITVAEWNDALARAAATPAWAAAQAGATADRTADAELLRLIRWRFAR
jgi:hypothetical protein